MNQLLPDTPYTPQQAQGNPLIWLGSFFIGRWIGGLLLGEHKQRQPEVDAYCYSRRPQ